MTEKESAHTNFADFASVDESEPMGHNETVDASNSTSVSERVCLLKDYNMCQCQ